MKQGPQKSITLLTTQMTATSNHEVRVTEEQAHFLPHCSPQQATMKQGPQKNITLLTTQMTATSNREARATEEHHTSYHTHDHNKQS